jgi:signal transduction histidine kinase
MKFRAIPSVQPPIRRPSSRRRAHAAPSASGDVGDQFFRHLVSNLRTGVLAITRDGRVAVLNGIACRVLGLDPCPEDMGRPYAEVLRDCPEVARVLESAFDGEDLPNRAEMRLRHTDKAIGFTASLIHDDAGHCVGVTLFLKDLTRVEELEERERLRDRLAALGEMAAAIAHEVKNPLASIEIMAGVLRRQFPDRSDAQESLDDIIKEVKMANAIVVEVLEFVRPIQLQFERVSLEELFKDAIGAADAAIPRGAVDVDVRISGDVPDLFADQYQLRQLFMNLLANAFDALRGCGHVEIHAALAPDSGRTHYADPDADPPPSQVVIDVRDSGPGISQDNLERIFSPFFTTKPQGTGLGLAIVRKVVDAHDGHIDAISAVGRGTTFRITLPVVPARLGAEFGRQ